MYSEKIKQILVYFIFGVLTIKALMLGGLFKSDIHKGTSYTIRYPIGWIKEKEETPTGSFLRSTEKPEIVTFSTPQKDLLADLPEASLTVLTTKLSQPTWIEDEFPEIVGLLKSYGYRVLDRGDIKINEQVWKWVLYMDAKQTTMNLEFYFVNDKNILFKMQYRATPEHFKKHRPAFEAAKDSFTFATSLW